VRKLLAFIAFLFISIIGCSSTTPLLIPTLSSSRSQSVQTNVYIDYRFSPLEQNDITNALKSWECSLGYRIRFKIQYNAHNEDIDTNDGKDLFIRKTDEKDPRIIEADKKLKQGDDRQDRFVVGLFIIGTDHPSVILLNMEKIGSDLWTISAHEIGHFLLGGDHSDDRNSIMYRFTDTGANNITEVDIKRAYSIYKLNPNDVKVCNIK